MERTPGLLVHIVEARRRLAGQPTSDILSMPHNNLLEGSIVLEEFIKVKKKNTCVILYYLFNFLYRNCHQLYIQKLAGVF